MHYGTNITKIVSDRSGQWERKIGWDLRKHESHSITFVNTNAIKLFKIGQWDATFTVTLPAVLECVHLMFKGQYDPLFSGVPACLKYSINPLFLYLNLTSGVRRRSSRPCRCSYPAETPGTRRPPPHPWSSAAGPPGKTCLYTENKHMSKADPTTVYNTNRPQTQSTMHGNRLKAWSPHLSLDYMWRFFIFSHSISLKMNENLLGPPSQYY